MQRVYVRGPGLLLAAFLLLTLGVAVIPREVGAATSPFDGKAFGVCLLWWGNVGDNGYTDAHQTGFVRALSYLQAKYPAVTFFVSRVVNVAYVVNKEAVYRTLVDNNLCDVVYYAFSDLYPSYDFIKAEAVKHPEKLYVVGDLRILRSDAPRNLVVAEPICDHEWFLAGCLVGHMYPSLKITMTVAFENATAYAAHALAAGIKFAQQGQALQSVLRVVPLDHWADEDSERTVATLALNQSNVDVVTHFSDPFVTSEMAYEFGKHSIGWGHDFSNYFLNSILTSVIRVYHVQFTDLIEGWLFNSSSPYQTHECFLQSFSVDVPTATRDFVTNVNATLNITEYLWTDAWYFNSSGGPILPGPLTKFQIGTLPFGTNFSILNKPFHGAKSCQSDHGASFVITSSGSYEVVCTRCPRNFFSRNGDACAPCTGVFASFCPSTSEGGTPSIRLILGLVIGVGGSAILITAALICYFKRKSLLLKKELLRSEPYTANSVHSRELYDEALVKSEIASKNYCLGAAASSLQGWTVQKCFLNHGTSLCMYSVPRKSADDAQRLSALLSSIGDHPNIVKVFAVEFNEEMSSIEIFCETSSGGTLEEMLAETKGRLNEHTARSLMLQITRALDHLHTSHCVHRSISPQNILLSSSGHPKLFCGPLSSQVEAVDASLTVVSSTTFTSPPELLTGMYSIRDPFQAACASDVWMVGLLAAQVLQSGESAWPPEIANVPSAIIARIIRGEGPVVPPNASEFAREFVEKACAAKASERPTAKELLQQRWFSKMQGSEAGSVSHTIGSLTFPVDTGLQRLSKEFRVGKMLGVGSFGTVHLVTMIATGEELAMKTISFDLQGDAAAAKRLERTKQEFDTLSHISHPNIVKYVKIEDDDETMMSSATAKSSFSGSTVQSSLTRSTSSSRGTVHHLRIFMEYVSGGTLKQHMVSCGGKLCEPEAKAIVRAMLRGLVYAHQSGIVHRDVKPSNFLYCGGADLVKLADFGSAAMVSGTATATFTMQGTLLYMAPEILREEPPTTAADVWSTGATVMEVLTGEAPWSNIFGIGAPVMAIVAYVTSNENLRVPDAVSPLAADFLKACLQRDCSQRPSAVELLKHPWLH